MDLRDRCHTADLCYCQDDVKGLIIERGRRFLIILHKTGGIISQVPKLSDLHHLFFSSPVKFTHLTFCCPEVPEKLPG